MEGSRIRMDGWARRKIVPRRAGRSKRVCRSRPHFPSLSWGGCASLAVSQRITDLKKVGFTQPMPRSFAQHSEMIILSSR